ncbi:MAG: transglutaminase domain-containing protein [Clostridia bacterium]|nr:transglutaminase domain-containing protein [Clostridia bacterium]
MQKRKCLRFCFLCLIFTLTVLAFTLFANAKESTLDENVNFELYEKIAAGIKAESADIYVGDGHFSEAELHATYAYVILQEPDFFYVGANYKYTMPQNQSHILSVRPTYLFSGEEKAQKAADFESRIDAILDLLDPAWTDIEKTVFLYEYVCSNFTYDDSMAVIDAYTMLLSKKGVCQGYTLLLDKLLTKIGIPCENVFSDAVNHIWNEVYLGGKWYHIDATFGDDLDDYTYGGFALHSYLLVSTDALLALEPKRTDMQYRYACTDKTYDGTAIQNVTSEIVFLNGNWYGAGDEVYRLNLQNGAGEVIADLPQNWHATPQTYLEDSFACLSAYKNILLYNTDSAICYYNPASGTSGILRTPISSYYYLYGFSVEGDALYYTLGNAPDKPKTQKATLSLAKELLATVTYKIAEITVKTEQYTKGDLLVLPKTPFTYKQNGEVYIIVGFADASEGDIVAEDKTVAVTLGELPLYTVTWIIDGISYQEKYVAGEMPLCPFDTSKTPTEDIYYAFNGFSPTPSSVTGDATYTALYKQERNYYFAYLVTDGAISEQRVVRGAEPIFPATPPQKAPYDQFIYTFSGWQLQSVAENGDKTYEATFTAIPVYQFSALAFTDAVKNLMINDMLSASYASLASAYTMSLSVNLEMPGVNEAKEALQAAIALYNGKVEQRKAAYLSDLQATFEVLPFVFDAPAFLSSVIALLPNTKFE